MNLNKTSEYSEDIENNPLATDIAMGASVYPEIMERDAWLAMLDDFKTLGFNSVRACDSAWGHIEKDEGTYQAEWLDQALDDLQARGFRVFLGTSTYLPPQWLAGKHPEGLVCNEHRIPSHPMARHSLCLNHEGCAEAALRLVEFLANRYAGHPAVAGWQLDNEIDGRTQRPCYCTNCEAAWQRWLAERFGDVESLNQALGLKLWGFTLSDFSQLPLVRWAPELPELAPLIHLLDKRFRRDCIAKFLKAQRRILTDAGISTPIFTDWMVIGNSPVDDDTLSSLLDATGLNFYPRTEGDTWTYWKKTLLIQAAARGATPTGRWFVSEARTGTAGSTWVWDRLPRREQLLLTLLQPLAAGSSGFYFWSSIQWPSGHWPHWGGLYDWSGNKELEWPWVAEATSWIGRHREALTTTTVTKDVAVITDYEQRAMLEVYEHVSGSGDIPFQSVEACHRLGLGVTALSPAKASFANLRDFPLVIVAAVPFLPETFSQALEEYVREGGTLVLGPLVDYQQSEGPFLANGFGSSLSEWLGGRVRGVKRLGSNTGRVSTSGLPCTSLDLGCEGWFEFWEDSSSSPPEVAGILSVDVEELSESVALFRRSLGRGTVWRLLFWPDESGLLELLQAFHPSNETLASPLPRGLIGIPRSDGSMILLNTTADEYKVELHGEPQPLHDPVPFSGTLAPQEIAWLRGAMASG